MKRNQYKFSLFLLLLLLWISGKSEVVAGNCAHGEHEYRPYVVRHADGEMDGIREYICTECGTSYTETIPKTGHDFSTYHVEQEPDCANEGLDYWLCTDCGKREYEILPFTEQHQYGEWVIEEEPACTVPGIREQQCRVCGDINQEPIQPTGEHAYEQTLYPASCTEDGQIVYRCRDCEDTYVEILDASGHQYGAPVVVKAAAPGVEGQQIRVCAHDSTHILEESIPALETEPYSEEQAEEETEPLEDISLEEIETEEVDEGIFNQLDLILSSINTIACGLYIYFIRRDQYILEWDKRKRMKK